MLLVMKTLNVIGAYRSVYCHSLTVVYCLVSQLVVCTVKVTVDYNSVASTYLELYWSPHSIKRFRLISEERCERTDRHGCQICRTTAC